jgi:hypothetical protein
MKRRIRNLLLASTLITGAGALAIPGEAVQAEDNSTWHPSPRGVFGSIDTGGGAPSGVVEPIEICVTIVDWDGNVEFRDCWYQCPAGSSPYWVVNGVILLCVWN